MFTRTNVSSVVQVKHDKVVHEQGLELLMPYIEMITDDKKTYQKYLDPTEYNVFVQGKFSNWEELTQEFFQNRLGQNLDE